MSQTLKPSGVSGGHNVPHNYRAAMLGEKYPEIVYLDSHSLEISETNRTETGDITFSVWDSASRQLVTRMVPTTSARLQSIRVDVGMPAFDHSYLDEIIAAQCIREIFRGRFDCNYRDRRAEVYIPVQPLDFPEISGQLVSGGTDPTQDAIGRTTGFMTPAFERVLALRGTLAAKYATGVHTVMWQDKTDCSVCSAVPGGIFVGGTQIGDAAGDNVQSLDNSSPANRWDSASDLALGLAATDVVTDMIALNDALIITWADNIDPATATTGGVKVYRNGSATEVEAAGAAIANALYGITRQGTRIVVVGADGKVFQTPTNDILNGWTDISDSTVTGHFLDVAATPQVVYIASADGKAYGLTGAAIEDITSDVDPAGAASSLNAVSVLDNKRGLVHVLFGGSAGFLSENTDAQNSDNWEVQTLGSATITAISGSTWRVLVGGGTTLYERSLLTIENNYEVMPFKAFSFEAGQVLTGNITAIATAEWLYGHNIAAVATDAGEVAYIRSTVQSA